MANKRMFTMHIVDSDAFLDMPLSAQCLYFHLNMRADDDGFVSNPRRIARLINASDDDLRLLVVKRFILVMNEEGVIVIKHWRMHNTIRKDRYIPTVYQEEKEMLLIKDNSAYSLTSGNQLATNWQPTVSTDIGIDIGIDIDKDKEYKKKRFTPPTLEEVISYFNEKKISGDPNKFYEYYSVANWHDSKGKPVKNWKQKALAVWDKKDEKPTFDVKMTGSDDDIEDVDINSIRDSLFG